MKKKKLFTKAEAEAFLLTWVRIKAKDGSTIAYATDLSTAYKISKAVNGLVDH